MFHGLRSRLWADEDAVVRRFARGIVGRAKEPATPAPGRASGKSAISSIGEHPQTAPADGGGTKRMAFYDLDKYNDPKAVYREDI